MSHQNGIICRAIPFGTMVAVSCICLFVILPLTLVGSVLGRNLAGDELNSKQHVVNIFPVSGSPDYPCRVNAVPRPIPEKKWFMEPWVIVALGGVLPFGSIFIEMYFIFTSFWAYKIYYVYGFMLLGRLNPEVSVASEFCFQCSSSSSPSLCASPSFVPTSS